MCNLAGYIGLGRAAPILINMLERQEGFGGGYHTGIAAIFNGKLYYRKVIGAVDELLRKTDALKLPGNISSTALAFPKNLESIVQAPIRSAMEFNWGDFEVCRLPDKTGPKSENCIIFQPGGFFKKNK